MKVKLPIVGRKPLLKVDSEVVYMNLYFEGKPCGYTHTSHEDAVRVRDVTRQCVTMRLERTADGEFFFSQASSNLPDMLLVEELERISK